MTAESNVRELESAQTVEICGVKMPIFHAQTMVPQGNKNYVLPEFTFDFLHDINDNKSIILTGHTGAGKSSLPEQIASILKQTLVRTNFNDQMTTADFVGTYTLKDKETVWVDGFLIKAMREGWWITLEEIDFAPPEILVYLNTLLETDGYVVLKEKGFEVIKPHPNFRLFATANTIGCMSRFSYIYQGARKMNDAFLDRFRIHYVPYMSEESEIKVVSAVLKDLRNKKRKDPVSENFEEKIKEMASSYVKVANAIRASFENETVSCTFSTRRLLDWVEASARHTDVLKGAKLALYPKMNPEDAKALEKTIESIFDPMYIKRKA